MIKRKMKQLKKILKTITVCVIVLLMGTNFSTSIHENNGKRFNGEYRLFCFFIQLIFIYNNDNIMFKNQFPNVWKNKSIIIMWRQYITCI